ncbi:uncharacterized protein LOC143486717 [Brachyhypopomus gauderio]|uniref:uncharacterized protein LOC143486717 n=1 Tax=Brachyhypopomus gauderio TaxID=698409 RepID=UPI0040412B6A
MAATAENQPYVISTVVRTTQVMVVVCMLCCGVANQITPGPWTLRTTRDFKHSTRQWMEALIFLCHRRRFAHWTTEAKDVLSGRVNPVFRIKRAREELENGGTGGLLS